MLMLSIVLHIEIIKPSRDSLLCSVEFREKIIYGKSRFVKKKSSKK